MTTSFNSALSAGQYTQLRRDHYQANQFISMVDNVLAFQSTMASTQPTVSGQSSAVLPYGTVVSGNISNLDEGMVVIVSPIPDPRHPLAVRLRLRKDVSGVVADGTNLYVSEYSDILGLNASIFVYYAYDLIDALSRPVSGVQLEDYNQPYQKMAPVIRGLQSAYVGWVDAAGHFDLALDASNTFAAESGATISSYLYSIKATTGGSSSVIAGSAATAIVTYRFSYGEYWLKLLVTDSNGVTWCRKVLIKAHHPTSYPPQTSFEGLTITRDIAQGPSGTVKFYGDVSAVLNGTMCVVWVDELYSDEDFSNPTHSLISNIDLIGWIEAETNNFQTDLDVSNYADVTFEIQGFGIRLARIEGQLLAFTNSASPTLWDQIKDLTPWRAIVHFLQRHTQALHLADFWSDNLDNTYAFPTIVTNAGRALDNLTGPQGIAEEINAQLEFARDGRIQLVRRAGFVTNYGAVETKVATWGGHDLIGQLQWKFQHYLQYGYLNADGAAWDGVSAAPYACQARAPGLALASGTNQGNLNSQILASTAIPAVAIAELIQRAGTQYAIDNNPGEMTVTQPDGYWWLETSDAQIYEWDLDSSYNVRGLTLDNNYLWTIKHVTVKHNNVTGSRDVSVNYKPIVAGYPGMYVPPVISGSVIPALPPLPPMPAFNFEFPETSIPDAGLPPAKVPPKLPVLDHNGQVVIEISQNGAALNITKNYILLAAPTWTAASPTLPSGYTLADAVIDQLNSTGAAVAVYALANNGTNSIVFYNTNVLSALSAWSQGATQTGVYTELVTTNVSGGIYLYTADPGQVVTDYDFTTGAHGWVVQAAGFGHQVNGQGWLPDDAPISSGTYYRTAQIQLTIPSANVIFLSMKYNMTQGSYATFYSQVLAVAAGVNSAVVSSSAVADGTGLVLPLSGSFAGITLLSLELITSGQTSPVYSGSGAITSARLITGSGSGAEARYSSNSGSTFGAALAVGASPGPTGGFDVSRASGVSYAAFLNGIKKATALGGAYSAFATPSASPCSIIIPYYQVGSNVTQQTTSATPHVVVGFNAVIAGTCLGWYDGAGAETAITQPVSGAVIDRPDCITMLRGTKMAVIVNVSGQYKLYVTENLTAAGTATWTFVKNVSATATLRSRRNDPRNAAHKGQLYVFDTPSGYSSAWANATEWARTSPSGTILSGDILG